MNRACPLCSSPHFTTTYAYEMLSGERQAILDCSFCSMRYASTCGPDYSRSIYERKVETPNDKERFLQTALMLRRSFAPSRTRILDVGCARGGMLRALRSLGFVHLTGMDPSRVCVEEVREGKFKGIVGTVASKVKEKFELIILSHVVEHVPDVRTALMNMRKWLSPAGCMYVEVPDATRYTLPSIPFLDLNEEHINHFTPQTLLMAFGLAGLQADEVKRKEIRLADGTVYPAIYAFGRIPEVTWGYVIASERLLARMDAILEGELTDEGEVALWGAGQLLHHLSRLPSLKKRHIVQVVDSNPSLHGKPMLGVKVERPEALHPGLPVVITSIVNAEAIKGEAKRLGIKNELVTFSMKGKSNGTS